MTSPRSPLLAPRSTLYAALFLFLFAVYLLTYTPRINSSDGLAMFATAESIVRRAALDIEQIRWLGLQQGTYGLDGLLYSRKGIGVPIGLLPLIWLGLITPWFGLVSASLLFNAIVTALTGVLLLVYLLELGFAQRTGLVVAVTFGLATLAWPYAKSLFSDPFSGLLLLAAAYFLFKFQHSSKISKNATQQGDAGEKNLSPAPLLLRPSALTYPFLAGLCLGWNVATRYAEALFVPIFGLLLLYYLFMTLAPERSERVYDLRLKIHNSQFTINHSQFIAPLLAFLAPLLLVGFGLIAFNLSRYGDPLNTGYLPNETFSAIWWQGIAGQLLSPGRGLLLYSPIFLLSLVGIPAFLRRCRPEAILALAIILIHLLLYGKWFMWHGGFAWGPRFMIPTLPFWALLLAPVTERAFPSTSSSTYPPSSFLWRLAYLTLAVLSLIPQLLMVSIDFSPFQGYLLDTGLPLFDPRTFFDPAFSPLLHGWRFIAAHSLDLAWAWQGQFNGWLLGLLLVNLGLSGLYLWQASRSAGRPAEAAAAQRTGRLALISTLMTLTFLLSYTPTLPERSLQDMVAALNEVVRPSDAIILNDPDITLPLAELSKSRAPVLGLNNGGFPLPEDIARRLEETMAAHTQIWWLPNWLPPEQSAVEQILLASGFRARDENYDGRRLVLFALPQALPEQVVEATFDRSITLLTAAWLPAATAGAALPVELTWQAQAPVDQDYHIFVHLLNSTGQIVAQADGQPALWTQPTSTWPVGQQIVDRHGLWLAPTTPPGAYHLLVGLYRPADGSRLTLPDGNNSVEFSLTIE